MAFNFCRFPSCSIELSAPIKFPSGDWHCIYCYCKFYGSVDESTKQMESCDTITPCPLLSCHLCEEKCFETGLDPIEQSMMDSGSWHWNYKIEGTHIQLKLVEL